MRFSAILFLFGDIIGYVINDCITSEKYRKFGW